MAVDYPRDRLGRVDRPRRVKGAGRPVLGLVAMAAGAFVYVTAETFPVGLLPQLTVGLHVHEAAIGLLVTIYAAAAGVSAVPLTALVTHRPRHHVLIAAVALLALTQFVISVAPDYQVVMAARLICAFAHGVFWAVLASVAASLAPPGKAGRGTAIVFSGGSLALVLGTPLVSALGQLIGWRGAAAVVGVAAALTVVALVVALPPLPSDVPHGDLRTRLQVIPAALRSRSLFAICAVTVLVVTGHYAAYTYIAPLVKGDANVSGFGLSAVLLIFGVAGIAGIGLIGGITDRRPRVAAAGSTGITAAALGLLAFAGHGSLAMTILAVILWGAAMAAFPVGMQSAVIRVAPSASDTASALFVVSYQVGIGGGSLLGSILVDAAQLRTLPVVGMALAAAGTLVLLSTKRAFVPTGTEA